jgi:hypothetical protein
MSHSPSSIDVPASCAGVGNVFYFLVNFLPRFIPAVCGEHVINRQYVLLLKLCGVQPRAGWELTPSSYKTTSSTPSSAA